MNGKIEGILNEATSMALKQAMPLIQRHVALMMASLLEEYLTIEQPRRTRRTVSSRRSRGEEITKWVADRRARRVPNFVIELTGGVDTKKKIVARFGENATFEKGKPLPKVVEAA